jgi:hypothetical protein
VRELLYGCGQLGGAFEVTGGNEVLQGMRHGAVAFVSEPCGTVVRSPANPFKWAALCRSLVFPAAMGMQVSFQMDDAVSANSTRGRRAHRARIPWVHREDGISSHSRWDLGGFE